MSMLGPRLDRPSVIGDEGRPRATSLGIATVVVVGLTVAGGWAIGNPGLFLSLGTIVGGTVAGVGLLNRDRFGSKVVGQLMFVTFGSFLVLWMLLVVYLGQFGLAMAGLAMAMVGVGVSWASLDTAESLQNALVGTAITYLVFLLSLGVVLVVAAVLLVGDTLVRISTAGVSPAAALGWFLLAVGYVTGSFRLLLGRLPVEQLTPYHKRPERMARLHRLRRAALVATISAPILVVVVFVVMVAGVFETLAAVAPPLVATLDALGSPWLLGVLGIVGTVELGVLGVALLLRAVTSRLDTSTTKTVAGTVAGVALALLMVTAVILVVAFPALSTLRTAIVFFAAFNLGPIALLVGAAVSVLAVELGVFPDRAGGPAVAATGLVLAAIGLGRAPSWVVFSCVAGAVVVWDVSAYGLGLTAELGRRLRARGRRGTAPAVAVLVLSGVDFLRVSMSGPGSTAAAFVAGLGVLLLLAPLRG